MDIMLFFESIRTALLNNLFLGITLLGQQEILIGLFCVIYWLVDKPFAYRIGLSAFAAIGLNQLLKITLARPRPFIRWPQLMPVSAALPSATGYSFPSGHTAQAVAAYGMGATRFHGWLRAVLWIIPFLVGLSRVYLGVHSLADVVMALVLGIPLVWLVNRIFDSFEAGRIGIAAIWAAGLIVAALLVLAGFIAPGSSDPEQSLDCFKAAGGIAGFASGFYIEQRWIHYAPQGTPIFQIEKLILGFAVTGFILVGIKAPLQWLAGEIAGSILRYGMLSLWIVAGLPLLVNLLHPKSLLTGKAEA